MSNIEVPIAGDVKVLFVKVCVPVRVTSPAPNSKVTMSGLVPSSAAAVYYAITFVSVALKM